MKTLDQDILPGFSRTPYELECYPDGHAYLVVKPGGLRGWTALREQALDTGARVIQRVMQGSRKGSEWTVQE